MSAAFCAGTSGHRAVRDSRFEYPWRVVPDDYHEMKEIRDVVFADKFAGGFEALASALKGEGFHLAITNTTATGRFVPSLKSKGFKVLSLVHELPN